MRKDLMLLVLCAATGVGCTRTRDSDSLPAAHVEADSAKDGQSLVDPSGRKAHPSWIRFDADGDFRALFPKEPRLVKSADSLGFEYRVSMIPDRAVSFYIAFTPNINTSVSLDTRLIASQDSMGSRNARRRTVNMCGYEGMEMTHEYTASNHTIVSRQRIFYVGTDMYQLLVLAMDQETFPEEDANLFFSGFELLKESKAK